MTAPPLERLALASQALDESKHGDLEAIEKLLAQRQDALEEFQRSWGAATVPLSSEQIAQLEAARSAGVRLRKKLLLDKAELREQATKLYRAACLVRALQPVGEPEQIDYRG